MLLDWSASFTLHKDDTGKRATITYDHSEFSILPIVTAAIKKPDGPSPLRTWTVSMTTQMTKAAKPLFLVDYDGTDKKWTLVVAKSGPRASWKKIPLVFVEKRDEPYQGAPLRLITYVVKTESGLTKIKLERFFSR